MVNEVKIGNKKKKKKLGKRISLQIQRNKNRTEEFHFEKY